MNKLIEKIKLDRKINKFLYSLSVNKRLNGHEEYTVVRIGKDLVTYTSTHFKGMVLLVDIVERYSQISYNRYLHNKIIQFIGIEHDYMLITIVNNYHNRITLDEYEEIIKKNKEQSVSQSLY